MCSPPSDWLHDTRDKLTRAHDLAKAIHHMLRRSPSFVRFLDDRRICLSNMTSIFRLGSLTSWPASLSTPPSKSMSCCRGTGGPAPSQRRLRSAPGQCPEVGTALDSCADPLRKFNISHEQTAFMFSIVWLRLAAWDY
jgi:hypothetical protein